MMLVEVTCNSSLVMSSPLSSPPLASRSPVDFPRDIWHVIADFLPEDDLVNLYSITGAWLNRALRIRYGSVILQNWEDPSIPKLLNHIRYVSRYSSQV
jgi:hypothetical protein